MYVKIPDQLHYMGPFYKVEGGGGGEALTLLYRGKQYFGIMFIT